ncbi:MAG: hypothetical protein LBU09_01340 [Endomicrobium sp.]|jgi:hypothetical protein|nr:hypothetical protein [Endomicrobium sp.]
MNKAKKKEIRAKERFAALVIERNLHYAHWFFYAHNKVMPECSFAEAVARAVPQLAFEGFKHVNLIKLSR